MTLTEWMTLAQTVIMFLTGVALVWYAWETVKIRRETGKQNLLLAKQIELTRSDQEYRRQSDMDQLKPIFHTVEFCVSDVTNLYFTLANKGGLAKDVVIHAEDGLTGRMTPNTVDTGETATLELREVEDFKEKEIEFKLQYLDRIGCKRSQLLRISGKTGHCTELTSSDKV
jgi:hypothetical protein